MPTCDTLIVGGGVIGLSIAYELAHGGAKITVVDRGEPGREASWAGAGILPPVNRQFAHHPLDQLRGLSCELHPQWAARLREETGIDNGYRRCGGFSLARTPGESALLAAWKSMAEEEGLRAELMSPLEAVAIEPGLKHLVASGKLRRCGYLPEESQIRNPRHLAALLAACRKRGASIVAQAELRTIERAGECATEAICTTPSGETAFHFQTLVVATGAWSREVASRLGISIGVLPIRGQMALFKCEEPVLSAVINEGSRYLVPRDDGRLLAGATEEEAGFNKSNTEEGVTELLAFAESIHPALSRKNLERTWAGLRPGSLDGLPYLGAIPGLKNAFLAAGHFRHGLQMSPATAVVLAQLVRGAKPEIDLSPFRVGRG
jgi:glycine oxidase